MFPGEVANKSSLLLCSCHPLARSAWAHEVGRGDEYSAHQRQRIMPSTVTAGFYNVDYMATCW